MGHGAANRQSVWKSGRYHIQSSPGGTTEFAPRILRCGTSPTLPARTNLPEISPRINPQIVIIVPRKTQRVLPDLLHRQSFGRRLEHRQRPRCQLGSLTRFPPRLPPLVIAKRARTGIPQKRKRITRPMPILPVNLHTGPRSQIDLDRLRIVRESWSRIKYRHTSEYRTPRRYESNVASHSFPPKLTL
jgi:hypothetical protein